MPKTKAVSPARSQGGNTTPKRKTTRGSRSLCSPALSTASGKLTSLIDQFKDKNMESFALSPLNGRSVLNDNTEIEEPRRKSWWKKLAEESHDVMEVLEDNKLTVNNAIEDFIDIEVLSQEKKNYTLDLPESSDNESINSIVLPQRRLFTQKENQPQKKFSHLIDNRESLAKLHKTNTNIDKTVNVGTRELFQNAKRSKPIFPAELLMISPNKTAADKTRENVLADPKPQVRNIFGNRPANKRKNMFADFIVSESEDEIPDIQPKVFGFQKRPEQRRISSASRGREASPSSSVTTDIELDFRMMLPSSTMVENQLEEMVANTPVKRARLSKLSEAKESEAGTLQTNTISDKSKYSNKSVSSKNKSKASPEMKDKSLNSSRITRSMLKNTSKVGENINTSIKQNARGNKSKSKISSQDDELDVSPTKSDTNKPSSTLNKSKNQSKIRNSSKVIETEMEEEIVANVANPINNVTRVINKSNKSLPNTTTNKSVNEKERTVTLKVHDKVDKTGSNEAEENEQEDDENNFTLTYENDEIIDEAETHNENQKENTKKHNTVVLEKDDQETEINKSVLINKSIQKLQKPAKTVEESVESQTEQCSAEDNVDGNHEMETENVQNQESKDQNMVDQGMDEVAKDSVGNMNEEMKQENVDDVNVNQENDEANKSASKQDVNVSQENVDEQNQSEDVANESQEVENQSEEEGNEDDEANASEEKNDEANASKKENDEANASEEEDEANESQEVANESQEVENEIEEEQDDGNQSQEVEVGINESQEIANESQEVENDENESENEENVGNQSLEGEAEVNDSQEVANESQQVENESEDDEDQANESQEIEAEVNESQELEAQANESREVEAQANESQEVEAEANESQEVEAQANESQEVEAQANESQEVEAEENESQEVEAEANESQEIDEEANESHIEEDDEAADQVDDEEMEEDEGEAANDSDVNEASANESQEVENQEESDAEVNESAEVDEDQQMDDSDEADKAIASDPEISDQDDDQTDEMEVDDAQESDNEESDHEYVSLEERHIEDQNEASEEIEESPNVTHDTTGRNRKKDLKSPEVVLHDKTNQMESYIAKGRNTSIRKTKSLLIRPSLAPPRDSTGFSDGTRNSSAEGSGWDSHRTTRKTLRQTFGKDFTPRKSLRAMVMEKSAKRQTEHMEMHSETAKVPLANSTEMPEDSNLNMDDVVESDHELSRITRQTTLEQYLQKIKEQTIENRLKMEAAVRNSLKAPSTNFLFKLPDKPAPRRPKPTQSKPKKQVNSMTPFGVQLPPEVIQDMKYKPPKRFQPSNAPWITKRLYKFLETKLEPKYDYMARVRAEKLVETIYFFVKDLRRHNVAPTAAVDQLKHEMARLNIVKTHFEFYDFFHEFMPRGVRIKVNPDIVNNIPLPRHGVFSDILRGNKVHG